MIQDFKNMKKKDVEPKANVIVRNHSPMTSKDRPLSERLTHEKIVKNFEHFTRRSTFQNMDPALKKLFYEGASKIINNAIEKENT